MEKKERAVDAKAHIVYCVHMNIVSMYIDLWYTYIIQLCAHF